MRFNIYPGHPVFALELPQESDIVLVEQTHVVNLVLQQSDALQSHAKCKACILLRIEKRQRGSCCLF